MWTLELRQCYCRGFWGNSKGNLGTLECLKYFEGLLLWLEQGNGWNYWIYEKLESIKPFPWVKWLRSERQMFGYWKTSKNEQNKGHWTKLKQSWSYFAKIGQFAGVLWANSKLKNVGAVHSS